MQYLYLLVQHNREAQEQDALVKVMEEAIERRAEEAREVKMTGAQALMAQGRKEGRKEGREEVREEVRKEGREEGRITAKREVLLSQLDGKFGALPDQTVAAVNMLTEDQLNTLIKKVLTATSLKDLGL